MGWTRATVGVVPFQPRTFSLTEEAPQPLQLQTLQLGSYPKSLDPMHAVQHYSLDT